MALWRVLVFSDSESVRCCKEIPIRLQTLQTLGRRPKSCCTQPSRLSRSGSCELYRKRCMTHASVGLHRTQHQWHHCRLKRHDGRDLQRELHRRRRPRVRRSRHGSQVLGRWLTKLAQNCVRRPNAMGPRGSRGRPLKQACRLALWVRCSVTMPPSTPSLTHSCLNSMGPSPPLTPSLTLAPSLMIVLLRPILLMSSLSHHHRRCRRGLHHHLHHPRHHRRGRQLLSLHHHRRCRRGRQQLLQERRERKGSRQSRPIG